MVIFTHVSVFAALKASTMFLSASESGGVWLVQNLTSLAPDWQLAPVIAVGRALPPALAEADDDALAAVDADDCWLGLGDVAPPQAATRRTTTACHARTDRWADRVIAPPPADAVLLPWSRLG
jgi:hypothetical protein